MCYTALSGMRVCWNRQTGTFEGRVSYGVWVQVPSLAPSRTPLACERCPFFIFEHFFEHFLSKQDKIYITPMLQIVEFPIMLTLFVLQWNINILACFVPKSDIILYMDKARKRQENSQNMAYFVYIIYSMRKENFQSKFSVS